MIMAAKVSTVLVLAVVPACASSALAQENAHSDLQPFAGQIVEELRRQAAPGTVMMLDLESVASSVEHVRDLAAQLGIEAVRFDELRICPPEARGVTRCRLPEPYAQVVRFLGQHIAPDGRTASVTLRVLGQTGATSHVWVMEFRGDFVWEEEQGAWRLEKLVPTLMS